MMMRALVVCVVLVILVAVNAQTVNTNYSASSLPGMVYTTSFLSNTYQLHWNVSNTDNRIYVVLKVQTTGWIGLGIAEPTSGGMAGADMLVAWIDDTTGAVNVQDRYATSEATPSLDSSQDWVACSTGSSQTAGWTTVYASRAMVTADSTKDRPIAQGTIPIVIAYGASDAFGQHASNARMVAAVKFWGSNYVDYSTVTNTANTQTVTYSVSNYAIPAQATTYAFQSWVLPATTAHVIAINMVLSAASNQYVHHLVLHDCYNNSFFRAVQNGMVGNPYPSTSPFTGAFNGAGNLNNPNSLVGNSNVCKAPIWAWAHGTDSLVLPPSAGIRIGTGGVQFLIAEIHYNNPSGATSVVDSSGFQLIYTTTLRANDAGMLIVGDAATRFDPIPANSLNVAYEAVCSPQCTSDTSAGNWPASGVNVFSTFLHMHQVGVMSWNTQLRDGKVLGVRGKVEYWNFGNQVTESSCYTILPGDQLNTHCVYSNTDSSSVVFGTASVNEMCMSFLMYYPRMTNIQTCGYLKDNGNVYDLCYNAAVVNPSTNRQVVTSVANSDNTTITKCFGGGTACAQHLTDANASCVAAAPSSFSQNAYCPAKAPNTPTPSSNASRVGVMWSIFVLAFFVSMFSM